MMSVGGLVRGLAGIAADRVSRRVQASLGALGYGLSLACWGLGQDWWVLAVGSLLLGVSSDALLAACEVALVDLAGDDLVGCSRPATSAPRSATSSGRSCWPGRRHRGGPGGSPFIVCRDRGLRATQPCWPLRPSRRPTAREPNRPPRCPTSGSASAIGRVWQLGAHLAPLRHARRAVPRLRHRLPRGRPGQSHGVAVLVGGSVVVGGVLGAGAARTRRRRSTGPAAGSVARRRRPSCWPVRCSGIMVAPAIPFQVALRSDRGRVQRAVLDHGCRPGSSVSARVSPARRRRCRLPLPARRALAARRRAAGRPVRPRRRARGLRGHRSRPTAVAAAAFRSDAGRPLSRRPRPAPL